MRYFDLSAKDYRLTTAEILYHFPDFPRLLQTYLWQELDTAPHFPVLTKFLNFWERTLEGKLHSVKIASCTVVEQERLMRYASTEILIH